MIFTVILAMTPEAPAETVTDPISGAFGIELGQPAGTLEDQDWIRLETRYGSEYKKYDPDDLLEFKTVKTSPASDTVVTIEGVRFYRTSKLQACHEDLGLILDVIKQKYPALGPDSTSHWKSEYSHYSFSTKTKYGFPTSRSVSLTCSPQDGGGSALIVTYSISPEERRALENEYDRAREQSRERSGELLKERGLDPDEL